MAERLLHLDGVHKRFGPVHALRGVALDVYPGEVHALIGENGAGKSTLMKVLSGAHLPDDGNIILDGKPYLPQDPQAGRAAGIAMIYQELNLADHLTIEENITLGMESHWFGHISHEYDRVTEALSLLGLADLDPKTVVATLNIGTKQMIEIARAIVAEADIIIMDEPTSSLSTQDTRNLFKVITTLREKGLAIIYISHFLEEVQEISDRYTILRDGETVGTGMIDDIGISEIIRMMVGRDLDDMYPHVEHDIGDVVLSATGIRGIEFPADASLDLRRGEIMGVFGLVGAGRSEMIRCMFGLDEIVEGDVTLSGGATMTIADISPGHSLAANLDLLSENRKDEGLAQEMSISHNTSLSALKKIANRFGILNLKKEHEIADKWVAELRTKCHSSLDPISSLSGGNQQKVAIARLLNHDSDIFFMDEPTRGIDVGSKSEIYGIIQELAAKGKSILVISSYLPELQGVCDTMAVMYRGHLSPKQPVKSWDDHSVMVYATTGKMITEIEKAS
jgi:ribose transport system ATP-binding protein